MLGLDLGAPPALQLRLAPLALLACAVACADPGVRGAPNSSGTQAGTLGAGATGGGGDGAQGGAGQGAQNAGQGAGGTSGAAGTLGPSAEPDAGNEDGARPDPVGTTRTAPGYVNLTPQLLTPLEAADAVALQPPAPTGWQWFPIEGALCRDGSPTGIFVRFTDSDKLFIYVEGGGACSTRGFCHFNPPNKDSAILGAGETVIGSALAVGPARQQPGVFDFGGIPNGMFDFNNPNNPYADWNGVYIPYCTGDVHFGSRRDAMVPNVPQPQQFVGHLNMQKFVGHLVPTFSQRVDRIILHGTSAGSFGAALNYSMLQDAFGDIPIDVVLDSGLPFEDMYMQPCMQTRWRELWGLDDSLPPDCEGCFNADGGGLLGLADYLIEKHPKTRLALISSMHDEVMRLFFSGGLNNCANIDTIDPFEATLAQVLDPNIIMTTTAYQAAVEALRSRYLDSGRLATYLFGGLYITFHQHVWRPRFYEAVSGSKTIADFVREFEAGTIEQLGP